MAAVKTSKESLSFNQNNNSPKSATLDDVIKRRFQIKKAQESLYWALINLTFMIFFVVDIKYSFLHYIIIPHLLEKAFYIFEIILSLILFINTIYDSFAYAWLYLWMKPIEVIEIQRKLLGIKENEIGFKIYTPKIDDKADEIKLLPTPPFEIKFNSSSNSSFANSPQIFTEKSSSNASLFANTSLNSLQNNSFNSSLNSTFNSTSASSWMYHRNNGTSSSPLNGEDSKLSTSSFRLRRSTPGKSKPIVDGESMNKYLKEFEEREERIEELRQAEKQQQHQSYTSSPWGMANSRINSNEQVGYQFFTNTSSGKEEIEKQLSLTTSPSAKALDSILLKLKINESQMNQWIENIRRWISQTVLSKIITEIDNVNKSLAKLGSVDLIIGEASLSAIKQTASFKKNQIQNFEELIPYLEVTVYQKYLVRRLRDLAKGGCMSEFNCNGGGDYNKKNWNEDLPTDSAMIMHAFCTYMDSRLPPNPNCPDGKTFTNQHFRSVSGPVPKSSFYISQIKVNPPHYKVVCDDEVWELPIGRNNLFHTLLVFLYCVKVKHYGLLGRINLGPSGVNILWVIENK